MPGSTPRRLAGLARPHTGWLAELDPTPVGLPASTPRRQANRTRPQAGKLAELRRCRNFQFSYLRLGRDARESVRSLLRTYHFIGVVERFEESVVALAIQLGIPSLASLLYLKAKVAPTLSQAASPPRAAASGASRAPSRSARTGVHLPLEHEPPEVRAFASSRRFSKANARDYDLHKHAKRALDRAQRDSPYFAPKLEAYRLLLAEARRECASEASTGCYLRDAGCGAACLDRLGGAAPREVL